MGSVFTTKAAEVPIPTLEEQLREQQEYHANLRAQLSFKCNKEEKADGMVGCELVCPVQFNYAFKTMRKHDLSAFSSCCVGHIHDIVLWCRETSYFSWR